MNIGYNRTAGTGDFAAVIFADRTVPETGGFPPLQYVNGQTCLEGLAETLKSAGLSDIIAVTGERAEDLREQIQRLQLAEHRLEDPNGGFAGSAAEGLKAALSAFPDKDGYFLIPSEYPLITIRIIRELCGACADLPGSGPSDTVLVPSYEGKPGQPLLVPATSAEGFIAASEGFAAEHEGSAPEALADLLRSRFVRVPCGEEECLLGITGPGGAEALDHFAEKGFRREKLDTLSAMKRIFMIRAAETEKDKDVAFRGRSDAPLSEAGRAKAGEVADAIAETISGDVIAQTSWIEGVSLGREPLPAAERVYCSDLPRAKETARIIADRINEEYGDSGIRVALHVSEDITERDLGSWEGKSFADLQKTDAEGLALREKDPFTFRAEGMKEDAYDLQYRVMAGLRTILQDDFAKNIIIVTHEDVIRAMENNLKELRIDDGWEPAAPGEYHVWVDKKRR